MKKLYNEDPNFSIIAPGSCNAACSFCFANEGKDTLVLNEYMKALSDTLMNLPEPFYQISITGGEPLLSPYIVPILMSIYPHKRKYTNVLLTTNGTHLDKFYDYISMSVDHINISRHHYDEKENQQIFKGTYDVLDADIRHYIDLYSIAGIDVSANCVIDDTTSINFIESYIAWAKTIGFAAVRFRKQNGSLDKTEAEQYYRKHAVLWKGTCPICETTLQLIKGCKVYWKKSIVEPTDKTNDIFEVVFGPDGKMYADWQYKIPIEQREWCKPSSARSSRVTPNSSRGGCGNTIWNSCGSSHSSSRC